MAWDILGWTLLVLIFVALARPAWLAARLRPLRDLIGGAPAQPPPSPAVHSPAPRPGPPHPAPERADPFRLLIALVIAGAADTVLAPFGEAMPVVFDLGVAAVLAGILGLKPPLMVALVAEAIPGVGLFPSWLAAVAAIAASERKRLT